MVGKLKKISTAITAVTVAFLMSSNAWADETFTFTTTTEEPTTVGGPVPGGGAVGGAFWTATSEVTFADGRKSTNTSTCISMIQPPRDAIFMTHSVCDGTGPDGNFTVISGCNWLNEERTENSCVGGLIGRSGRYEGRRGSVTIHGKDNGASGTGQWFE